MTNNAIQSFNCEIYNLKPDNCRLSLMELKNHQNTKFYKADDNRCM